MPPKRDSLNTLKDLERAYVEERIEPQPKFASAHQELRWRHTTEGRAYTKRRGELAEGFWARVLEAYESTVPADNSVSG